MVMPHIPWQSTVNSFLHIWVAILVLDWTTGLELDYWNEINFASKICIWFSLNGPFVQC